MLGLVLASCREIKGKQLQSSSVFPCLKTGGQQFGCVFWIFVLKLYATLKHIRFYLCKDKESHQTTRKVIQKLNHFKNPSFLTGVALI